MRVEVLGGVERRRRWSGDDKMRIIEETLAPGAVVTEIARRHGISTSLVFTWRRRARLASVVSAGPKLVPVQLTPAAAESVSLTEAPAAIPPRRRRGLIEIELGGSTRVSVDENVDAEKEHLTLNDFSFLKSRELLRDVKGNISDAVIEERRADL